MVGSESSIGTSRHWLVALRDLPLPSRGLLLDLLVEVAQARTPTLQVDQALLESLSRSDAERHEVARWFAELLRHDIVREVDRGIFLIAPGLLDQDSDEEDEDD